MQRETTFVFEMKLLSKMAIAYIFLALLLFFKLIPIFSLQSFVIIFVFLSKIEEQHQNYNLFYLPNSKF